VGKTLKGKTTPVISGKTLMGKTTPVISGKTLMGKKPLFIHLTGGNPLRVENHQPCDWMPAFAIIILNMSFSSSIDSPCVRYPASCTTYTITLLLVLTSHCQRPLY
jgi:hypothetical protein